MLDTSASIVMVMRILIRSNDNLESYKVTNMAQMCKFKTLLISEKPSMDPVTLRCSFEFGRN